MAVARLKAAGFPVKKSFEDFDFSASSIPRATLDYLASLEWGRAKENPCLVGPPGTAKSHVLIALGHAAVDAGYKVRYFSAAELVESLYRGLADNSVGGSSSRCCGPTPSSSTSSASPLSTTPVPSCCSASSPLPTSDVPWPSGAIGPSRRLGPFPAQRDDRSVAPGPPAAPQHRRSSPTAHRSGCARRARREARSKRPEQPNFGVGRFSGHQRGVYLGH